MWGEFGERLLLGIVAAGAATALAIWIQRGITAKAKIQAEARNYRAHFLWPHEPDSIEEAGYEFVNSKTELTRRQWWNILLERLGHPPHVDR